MGSFRCWRKGHVETQGFRVFGRLASWCQYCERCGKILGHEPPNIVVPDDWKVGGLPPVSPECK